ncbi:hypothetical protein P3342_001729 [Pyrenophora teres f. teres]|nr:hypothetical protein P3342_001729 [Pyrenophora teres f. teres]
MPPSEAVAKLLRKEECPRWPDDQFQSTAFDERSAAHMLQQYRLKGRHNTGTAQPTRRAQSQTSARTRDQDAEEQQTDAQVENRTSAQVNQQLAREGQQRTFPLVETIEQTPQTNERRQADQRQPSQQPRLTYNNFDRFREYTPAYPQRPKGISIPPIIPSDDTDPYKAIPPIECGNEKLDPQKINVFSKMWDREKKYTGKPYDLLDDKLKIFYSICYHADIQPEQFHAVFPRILEGRAQDYYLHFVKPYYRPDHLWSDPDAPYTPKETHEPQEPMAAHAYITRKEQDDHELAIKLRNDGVITTSGAPFEASDDQISDLVGRGVFKFEQYNEKADPDLLQYERQQTSKSRQEAMTHLNHQRCSQRLIMSLALMQSGMSVAT